MIVVLSLVDAAIVHGLELLVERPGLSQDRKAYSQEPPALSEKYVWNVSGGLFS